MKPKVTTGAISAPFTDLTRQWTGHTRADYADGTTAIGYDHNRDERQAWLVFDRNGGTRAGFYWGKDQARGIAVRAFRNGRRADHHAQRLHHHDRILIERQTSQ